MFRFDATNEIQKIGKTMFSKKKLKINNKRTISNAIP